MSRLEEAEVGKLQKRVRTAGQSAVSLGWALVVIGLFFVGLGIYSKANWAAVEVIAVLIAAGWISVFLGGKIKAPITRATKRQVVITLLIWTGVAIVLVLVRSFGGILCILLLVLLYQLGRAGGALKRLETSGKIPDTGSMPVIPVVVSEARKRMGVVKNVVYGVIIAVGAVAIAAIIYGVVAVWVSTPATPSPAVTAVEQSGNQGTGLTPVQQADYQEAYKGGYVDGRSFKGKLGDNYQPPATEERRPAYLLGYVEGFTKGCREGNFDCSAVENALRNLVQGSGGGQSQTNIQAL